MAELVETCVDDGSAVSMKRNTVKVVNSGKSVTFSLATVTPTISNTTTISTSTASIFKLDDELESNYKIENYITAQQIDDMISKHLRNVGEGTLKKTAAMYDLNLITNVRHNVIVDPETGQVESVVCQEYDTPTTPQCFYVNSPAISLEIIEEEDDDVNNGKQSISTQTEFLPKHHLQSNTSHLSVRCSNESISNYIDTRTPKATGFYNRYCEVLMADNSRSLSVEKSRSVPCLGSSRTNLVVQHQLGSSAAARPLSVGLVSTDATVSVSASTGLSQYMNSEESESSRPTSYYSSQEEIRRLQELCGIRPANPSPRSRTCSMSSQTGSTTYKSVANRWSTSSSNDLSSTPICQRTNSEHCSLSTSSVISSSSHLTSARSDSTDWKSYSGGLRHSTTTSITNTDWTDTKSGLSSGQAYPLRRSAYSRCISSDWSDAFKPSTSSTSSMLEEVTNSLDELSRKIDAYIQKKKTHHGRMDSGSDTGTDSTVRYIPDLLSATSDGNETDYTTAITPCRYQQPTSVPTLKKLSLKAVLSSDRGIDLLSDIYFMPPQKSAHLNRLYTDKGLVQVHWPQYTPQHVDSTPQCPRIILPYIPSTTTITSVTGPSTPDPLSLLDNHQKFMNRRSYHENQHFRQWRTAPQGSSDVVIEDSLATPRSCVLNVDENYTKELLEEAANLLAVRKYRKLRLSHNEHQHCSVNSAVFDRRTANLEFVQEKQQKLQQSPPLQFINEINPSSNNEKTSQVKIDQNRMPSPPVHQSPDRHCWLEEGTTASTTAALLARPMPEKRAKSLPVNDNQDIRQKMYTEYMRKVAERIERRHNKQIRIYNRPLSVPNMIRIFDDNGSGGEDEKEREAAGRGKVITLEEEFMQKARMRLIKMGIKLETTVDDAYADSTEANAAATCDITRDGGRLPSHLQELIKIIDHEEEESNVGEFVEGCKQGLCFNTNNKRLSLYFVVYAFVFVC